MGAGTNTHGADINRKMTFLFSRRIKPEYEYTEITTFMYFVFYCVTKTKIQSM